MVRIFLQKKKHKKSKKTEDGGEEAGEKKEGKRAARATSNVFGMFPQTQIQEFKEVSQLNIPKTLMIGSNRKSLIK